MIQAKIMNSKGEETHLVNTKDRKKAPERYRYDFAIAVIKANPQSSLFTTQKTTFRNQTLFSKYFQTKKSNL